MVGRIQDIVSASIVAGAAERISSDTAGHTISSENQDLHARRMEEAAEAHKQEQQAEEDERLKAREEREPMDEQSVSYMTKKLNELMSKINGNLEFQYHKEVNLMSVRMLDKKTNEVLKEVPPEEMLDQMAKAREWLGAFLDKNA